MPWSTSPSLFFVARDLSTETTTPSAGPLGGAPPPGFKLEEARKPLSSEKPVKSDKPPLEKAQIEPTASKNAATQDSKLSSTQIVTTDEKALDGSGNSAAQEKKLTVWQKVKHGVQHFWDGTKLLGMEIKISWNLALKMAAGYELSRRERRQVRDIGSFVPGLC